MPEGMYDVNTGQCNCPDCQEVRLAEAAEERSLPNTGRDNCMRCGVVTSDLYAYRMDILCEECYCEATQTDLFCAGCQGPMNPYENFRVESLSYCPGCARGRLDMCSHCGVCADQGTMRRPNERPVCGSCYQPEWTPGEWESQDNTFEEISERFTFGIELETSRSDNFVDLEGNTLWGCVPETSTSGKEFVSPVLKGDKGLEEVQLFIREWGSDWTVNSHCGTHIHIGLHALTLEQKRQVAYGYLKAWPFIKNLIGSRRAGNSMCGSPQWDLGDLMNADDIEDFAAARDRFEFVNWRSLLKYGTIEIRCLQGTLDYSLIKAWTCWHVAFIERASGMASYKLRSRMENAEEFCESVQPEHLETIRNKLGTRQPQRNRLREAMDEQRSRREGEYPTPAETQAARMAESMRVAARIAGHSVEDWGAAMLEAAGNTRRQPVTAARPVMESNQPAVDFVWRTD